MREHSSSFYSSNASSNVSSLNSSPVSSPTATKSCYQTYQTKTGMIKQASFKSSRGRLSKKNSWTVARSPKMDEEVSDDEEEEEEGEVGEITEDGEEVLRGMTLRRPFLYHINDEQHAKDDDEEEEEEVFQVIPPPVENDSSDGPMSTRRPLRIETNFQFLHYERDGGLDEVTRSMRDLL